MTILSNELLLRLTFTENALSGITLVLVPTRDVQSQPWTRRVALLSLLYGFLELSL